MAYPSNFAQGATPPQFYGGTTGPQQQQQAGSQQYAGQTYMPQQQVSPNELLQQLTQSVTLMANALGTAEASRSSHQGYRALKPKRDITSITAESAKALMTEIVQFEIISPEFDRNLISLQWYEFERYEETFLNTACSKFMGRTHGKGGTQADRFE